MTTDVAGGVNTFLQNHGQVKHVTSVLIPSPKKGDFTKGTNNCTTALFPNANKIFERNIQKQLQKSM